MRIWSVHPRYLDAKGLVALWRETLLARAVITGHTKGYTRHPQLYRFLQAADPLACIDWYLSEIHKEAQRRGYSFDPSKFIPPAPAHPEPGLQVTKGQIDYEWTHLMGKLLLRDPGRHAELSGMTSPDPHPLFTIVPGGVEAWEIIKKNQISLHPPGY